MNEKTVLITGASSGIGKSTAALFLRKGYTVYASAPNLGQMSDLKEMGAHLIKLDISNKRDCQNAVDLILKESGRINILINNAGYGLYGSIEDVTIEDARRQFEVNLFGLVELTKFVLPSMRNNQDGRIINISSILGAMTLPMGGWYHASKYALEGITDCLRQEVKAFRIKVILINPGAIESNWAELAFSHASNNSGDSIYKEQTIELNELFKKSKILAGKADQVAQVIVQASEKKRPKIRYLVPFHAKLIWFIRRISNERFFKFISSKLIKYSVLKLKPIKR